MNGLATMIFSAAVVVVLATAAIAWAQSGAPTAPDPVASLPPWAQGGLLGGLLVAVLAWVAKVLIPSKDKQATDILATKDKQNADLLAAKDGQLAAKDLQILGLIEANRKERSEWMPAVEKLVDKVSDKYQALFLKLEAAWEKQSNAADARVEKLCAVFTLDGKESREHQQNERRQQADTADASRKQHAAENEHLKHSIEGVQRSTEEMRHTIAQILEILEQEDK